MICLLFAVLQGAALEPQDPDRIPVSASDFKALTENNIFAPHKARRVESTRREERRSDSRSSESPRSRSKPPVVTGIFLDTQSREYQALVEDRNSGDLKLLKEPRFVKAGDEILGCTVESVSVDRVVIVNDDKSVEVALGESLPGESASAPAEPAKSEAPPVDEASRNSVLEELKKKLKKKRSED